MKNNHNTQAVKKFVEYWKDRGSERAESQKFWLNLLQNVLGVENPTEYINFEDPVMMNNTGFIDGFIDNTKVLIEQTAKAILDARNLYPESSLADLYNELIMPKELRKAHQENDRAVMKAYGFTTKMTEAECVAELMKMYKEKVEKISMKVKK